MREYRFYSPNYMETATCERIAADIEQSMEDETHYTEFKEVILTDKMEAYGKTYHKIKLVYK